MKHVYAPHLGRHVTVGARKRPAKHLRAGIPQMSKYQLAVAPDFDYTTLASQALSDILGNDALGDCTSAGAGHLIDVFTAGGGTPVAITAAEAIEFYSLSTGYQPGNPATDRGGDEITVLTAWRDKGYDGHGAHPIAGFVSVDPSNAAELKSACYYFGGLYFGLELPDTYTNPFPSSNGFVWGPGTPDLNQGHCIVGAGGNSTGILVDTWGLIGTFTYAGIAELCSEAAYGTVFAVVSREWVNAMKGQSPSGLDWAALEADFKGLGGSVTPDPAPVPPVPTGPVTLAQAQAWATAALKAAHPLMTRAQAISTVTKALAASWPVVS